MDDSAKREFRSQVLTDCGATGDAVIGELLAYNENPFQAEAAATELTFPLADEPHIESWSAYANDAREMGAFAALARRFVQLNFPIRSGISQEEDYRNGTRKGRWPEPIPSPGLELNRASDLELSICPTMAGQVPVLVVGDRDDFVALVRAFTGRNEPIPVPDAMGACIVTGFNNWDRIAAYRRKWEEGQPEAVSEEDWSQEFKKLVPRKELYQDRFIILSRGPYSATAAGEVGLEEEEWLDRSLVLRREHEFTHYFTFRVFGAMRNNLLDELIADFVGIARAFGSYRPELALRFFGLESYPRFREGGRLETYRGKPPLSDPAFEVLQCLALRSVENLAAFSTEHTDSLGNLGGLARMTYALAGLTVEELASSDMTTRIAERIG